MESTEINQVYKWGRIALIVLVVFLAIQALNGLKTLREPSLNSSVITVTGEGEAFAIPDLATFSFTVSADKPTVEEAQTEVTKKMDSTLAALEKLGVEERDLKTVDYSVWPKYVYPQIYCIQAPCPSPRQEQDGYTVSHSVMVKIRDTEKAGEALSLAGSLGVSNLSGISFTVDNPDTVMAEARQLAIEEAKEKAEVLAQELGVKVVRVISFSDGFDGGTPYYPERLQMGNATDMAAKAPDLPVGENRVQANVTITYEIR